MHLTDTRFKVVGKIEKPWYASSSPGIRKLTLGWKWVYPKPDPPDNDDAVRVQTFVHEAAHISGRTNGLSEEKYYGRTSAHDLADSGMKVTRNADNYGFYAIDVAMMWR